MSALANFKIRTQVLLALLPLVLMVLIAGLYISVEMKKIDTGYTDLIDKDVEALQSVTVARALNDRFGQFLYKEIAELDIGRMRLIDADLDRVAAEVHSSLDLAKRHSPDLAPMIDAAAALFEEAVSHSYPVRRATQAQDNGKAMGLMHAVSEPALVKARQALVRVEKEMQQNVERKSAT